MPGNFSIRSNFTGKEDPVEVINSVLEDLRNFSVDYQRFINMQYGAGTKGGNYTCTSQDNVILVDGTAGVTITLPNPIGLRGKQYTVKDWKGIANLRNINILSSGTHLLDGTSTPTILSTAYQVKTFVSDNLDWFTI